MWKKLKSKSSVTWGIHVSPAFDNLVRAHLKERAGERVSLSVFVEEAVSDWLTRKGAAVSAGRRSGDDALGLAAAMGRRKHKVRGQKAVRWCILVPITADAELRLFLRRYRARHGALVRVVEQAVIDALGASTSIATREAPAALPLYPAWAANGQLTQASVSGLAPLQ